MTRQGWAALIAGALVLAVYLLRLDHIVGIIGDDAWYALLGRTLARGDGFQQPNSPTPGLLPYLPPGFPLLLAPLWYLAPEFPANVALLKALSVVAMLAAGALTYAYSRAHTEWPRELALIVAVVVALVPSLVFLTTSTLMSEPVFLALQLATILVLERGTSRAGTVVAGVGAAVVTLIRTIGVVVPVGAILYLCLKREWRRAALFGAVVALTLAPWQLYVARHSANAAAQGSGEALPSYSQAFWQQWASDAKAGTATVRDLPLRFGQNTVDVITRDQVALVAPSLLRGAHQSGLELLGVGSYGMQGPMGNGIETMALSAILFLLMAVGWVGAVRHRLSIAEFVVPLSLAVIIAWPFWTFRFILPLAPFLLVYMVEGLRTVTPAASRVPMLAMLGIAGLSLFDHGEYLTRARVRQPDWSVYAEDTDAVLAWLQQNPSNGPIAASNPALVNLRTGTPTIQLEELDGPALRARGVRYVVWVHPVPMQVPADQGAIRFVSPRLGFWVLEL
jgi:hypothetical protein